MPTPELWKAINACTAAEHYSAMYASLSNCPSLKVDLKARNLSHALYFQLCKMKYAAWRYRIQFSRARRHSMADVFQDLVAFYLRAALPKEYQVSLEVARKMDKGGKKVTIQPDICITRQGKTHFVVEAKTTIGWARPDFKLSGDAVYQGMLERIENVASSFDIPKSHVIFVFEEPTNVSTKHFLPIYWDTTAEAPVRRPIDGILAQIYPLYMTTDPYYWNWQGLIPERRERTDWFPSELTDEEILKRARTSVVTPFEDVVALIQGTT